MENIKSEYQLEQNRVLKIYQDDNSESPDAWGNTDMFLVYSHRQFTVTRKGFNANDIYNHISAKEPRKEDYSNEDDYQLAYNDYAESINLEYNNYYIFPVAAYIHSGIVLSLTDSLERQGWDTSVLGFILVKKELVENTKTLDANKVLDKNPLETRAKEYAEGLIETWNQYLSGDIWGFRVFKKIKYYKIPETDFNNLNTSVESNQKDYNIIYSNQFIEIAKEVIELEEEDSCWGFYGSDIKTNGILDTIDYKLLENENTI